MSGLPATLDLDAAAAIRWDALVVGAGPAGAAAALRLARHGLQVLLIDRGTLPRGKLCGCCLSPAAVAELRRLGMPGDESLALAVPLRRIRLACDGREAGIDVRGGATLSREVLDATLAAAAVRAGAQWLPRTAAVAIDEADDGEPLAVVAVRGAAGDGDRTVRLVCRRLLLATGLGDRVRRPAAAVEPAAAVSPRSRIGIGAVLPAAVAALPPGELLMAVAAWGYCGIVRLEDGRLDVAAAVDRRGLAAVSPAATIRRIVRDACGPGSAAASLDGLDAVAIRATPALTRSAPLVAGTARNVFRIGDAAGYVEPFTGEGMGWALAAGRLVAESLVEGRGGGLVPAAVAADRYARVHARSLGPRQARCRGVAAGLRHPGLVGLAVRAARLAPWAARLAVPAVVGGRASRPGFAGGDA
jgi:flavin-dependent dehydrogenase